MKQISFLSQFIAQEIILGMLYSIIPSIGLGIIIFVTGFPIGIMIGITLGAINGLILGIICILFLNNQKNIRIIKYTFIVVSVIVTFIGVYILTFSFPLYYNYSTNMLNIPELRKTLDYRQLHLQSSKISLPISLIAGYASRQLSNWYLNYRQQEML